MGNILSRSQIPVLHQVGGGCSLKTLKEEVFIGIVTSAPAEGEKQQQKCRGGK